MIYPLYIFLGLVPSIIWLLFYLRKDAHPEPKLEVIKIFVYGMLVAILAVFLERGFFIIVKNIALSPSLIIILNTFAGVALIEEFLKYFVIRETVLNSPEFDEPIDAILYMMIAALGFAAVENIMVLFQLSSSLLLSQTLFILGLRFLGATFLHVLCSGTVGYWLALSFESEKKEIKLPIFGLIIAIVLHGFYNFFIIKGGGGFFVSVAILISLALFVSFGLKRAKEMSLKKKAVKINLNKI